MLVINVFVWGNIAWNNSISYSTTSIADTTQFVKAMACESNNDKITQILIWTHLWGVYCEYFEQSLCHMISRLDCTRKRYVEDGEFEK